jgi:hypothetical protein
MSLSTQNFETKFGFKTPEAIIELLSDDSFKKMPTRLQLKQQAFVIDLQYLLDITNVENFDVSGGRFKFAVTTDGFELLVDLKSDNMDILQDEFGDIDSLGITVRDLVEASKKSI